MHGLSFLLPSFFHSVKGAFLTRSIVLIAPSPPPLPSPSTLRSFTTCINTAPLPPRAHGSVVCVRGEREVLLLLTRPFPRSRYRSHFRETLPFCEIIVLQTLFHVLSCVTHRKIMALSDSSSRFPFTLQGSHRNHANISPLLLLLLVPLLLLTNFEISQTPFRHPIK